MQQVRDVLPTDECVEGMLPIECRAVLRAGDEDVVHAVLPFLERRRSRFMATEMNGSLVTLPGPRRRVAGSPAPRRYRRRDSLPAHGPVDRPGAWDRCRLAGRDSHACGAGSGTSSIPIQSLSAADASAIAMRCRVPKVW